MSKKLNLRAVVITVGTAIALIVTLVGAPAGASASAQRVPANPGQTKSGGSALPPVTVCWTILNSQSVPQQTINGAIEDPTQIGGWDQVQTPGKAESWMNPRRRSLSMLDKGKPYNALNNGLIFRSGCY